MRSKKNTDKTGYIRVFILTAVLACTLHVSVNAGTVYTGPMTRYAIWRTDLDIGENKAQLEKTIPYHYDFESDGSEKTTMYEERILPKGAERIWWGQPKVECCSACEALASAPGLYSCRIFLEDDQGNEFISKEGVVLEKEDLAATGIDFEGLSEPVRVGIELVQRPGDICSACGKRIGSRITVDNLSEYYPLVKFSRQPSSVTVSPGGSATFSVSVSLYRDTYGRPQSEYRWVKWENDRWVEITDNAGADSDVYSGAGTVTLRVDKISSALNGARYSCRLKGARAGYTYSDAAVLSLPGSSGGGQTPTDPGELPPVIPVPGSGSYTPAASTSSYVPVYPPPSGGNSASSSSVTIPAGDTSDGGSYTGTVVTPGELTDPDPGSKITAGGPGNTQGGGSGTNGGKGGTNGGNKGTKGGKSGSSSGGRSSSLTSSSKKPGKGYVMKNGILYIVDDDQIPAGASSSDSKDAQVETDINEQEYSASDLALAGQLREQSQTAGFFDTFWGRVLIIAASLLILLLLLFFLFFGVIVFGEVEEHDEVFELCAIRLMKRKEGNWCIRLGEAFDENAVLKLRIGLLFALIFEDWDLEGEVTGMYEGSVSGVIQQGMMLYRKNIRRSV
ncbi:MAG: immunoglobulin domain-containing protein [Lachnospiraceae bacterium]|nr:immunoglobulin domain-containing protein [Lachnospiraceae bacterium]